MFVHSYHTKNLAQTHLDNLECQNLVVDYTAFVVASLNNLSINLDLYRDHYKKVEKQALKIAVAGCVVDFHKIDFNDKVQKAAAAVEEKASYSSIGFVFRNVD